jgi:hypothetical protein
MVRDGKYLTTNMALLIKPEMNYPLLYKSV